MGWMNRKLPRNKLPTIEHEIEHFSELYFITVCYILYVVIIYTVWPQFTGHKQANVKFLIQYLVVIFDQCIFWASLGIKIRVTFLWNAVKFCLRNLVLVSENIKVLMFSSRKFKLRGWRSFTWVSHFQWIKRSMFNKK